MSVLDIIDWLTTFTPARTFCRLAAKAHERGSVSMLREVCRVFEIANFPRNFDQGGHSFLVWLGSRTEDVPGPRFWKLFKCGLERESQTFLEDVCAGFGETDVIEFFLNDSHITLLDDIYESNGIVEDDFYGNCGEIFAIETDTFEGPTEMSYFMLLKNSGSSCLVQWFYTAHQLPCVLPERYNRTIEECEAAGGVPLFFTPEKQTLLLDGIECKNITDRVHMVHNGTFLESNFYVIAFASENFDEFQDYGTRGYFIETLLTIGRTGGTELKKIVASSKYYCEIALDLPHKDDRCSACGHNRKITCEMLFYRRPGGRHFARLQLGHVCAQKIRTAMDLQLASLETLAHKLANAQGILAAQ